MYRLDLSLEEFQNIKQCLSEIHPEIEFSLASCDYALANLGFVKSPPCVAYIKLSTEEMKNLLDELMNIEVDAADMPIRSQEYQAYIRYGWLWDIFFSAKPIRS